MKEGLRDLHMGKKKGDLQLGKKRNEGFKIVEVGLGDSQLRKKD